MDKINIKLIIQKINDLKSVEFHKSIATRQRKVYNKQRKDPNLLKNKILIDVDYKSKITLGEGPRQLNSEVDKTSHAINCLNIDLVSDYDGSTAGDLIRCFKFLMDLEEFKNVDEENYIIWSDCGSQFRCAEFNYFLFNDLTLKSKCVNMYLFAEKHGKNMRDQHFALVSLALKKEMFKKQSGYKSGLEVVETLNKSSIYFGKTLNISKAFYFNPPETELTNKSKRLIPDLQCYYNLQNILNDGVYEFFSSVYSGSTLLVPVDSTIELIEGIKFTNRIDPKINQIVGISNQKRSQTINENLTKKWTRMSYISIIATASEYKLNFYFNLFTF